MALIFFEGFETDGAAFWGEGNGSAETSIVYAGLISWKLFETTDYHSISDTSETWLDFYWYTDTVSANFHHIAAFMASSLLIAGLRVGTDGKLAIYRGTTLIGTGTTVLSVGTWYHISIHILRDATSGVFDVDLNGVPEITFAGNTGPNNFNRFRFASGNAATTDYFDNISDYDAAPGAPLVADFSGTPLSGPVPLDVDFTDLSTGSVIAWDWDFGDAYSAFSQNPSHLYSSIGIFTVALTVADVTSSDTETKIDYIEVLGPPIADFSGTPLSGTAPLSVAFTDLSTNSPTAWTWDFGDGTSATTQNPTHIYNYVGVYTVTLIVSSSAGIDSETKIAYITVTAVAEVGPAEIENCDIDTGGLAVGLRVADVAIARDNNLGSLVIDASAELRAKDNAYSTLTNNGTLTPLAGDRATWDTLTYYNRHASDISDASFTYHVDPANPPLNNYLGSGSFFVGNGSDQAVGVTMSGDATLNNAGVLTIAPLAVDGGNIAASNGSIYIGGADGAAHEQTISGDASISNAGALTLTTVNATPGTYGDDTHLAQITVDEKGRITAIGTIVFTGSGGGEVLMADGITPPDPLTTDDETDWLYTD